MATGVFLDILTCAPNAPVGKYTESVFVETNPNTPNYYDGGVGYIDDYLIYNGQPAKRLISLFTEADRRLIEETWSDPTTGYYRFDRLKNQKYFCVAFDYLKVYDNVSHELTVEGV